MQVYQMNTEESKDPILELEDVEPILPRAMNNSSPDVEIVYQASSSVHQNPSHATAVTTPPRKPKVYALMTPWILMVLSLITIIYPLVHVDKGWITVLRPDDQTEAGYYGWNTATPSSSHLRDRDPPLYALPHPFLMGCILAFQLLVVLIYWLWLTYTLLWSNADNISRRLQKWCNSLHPLCVTILAVNTFFTFIWYMQITDIILKTRYLPILDDAFLFMILNIASWVMLLYYLVYQRVKV